MEISVQKLCNEVSMMEYSELLGKGREIVSNLMDMMMERYQKDEKFTFDLISNFAIYAVSIDGRVSEKEASYINEITGLNLTHNEIKNSFAQKKDKGIDIFNILGSFKSDILESFIYLASYIFVVDDKINEHERKILRRLNDSMKDKNRVLKNVIPDKQIRDDLIIAQNELLNVKSKLNEAYKDYSAIDEEYTIKFFENYNKKKEYVLLLSSLNDLKNGRYTELKNKTSEDAVEIKRMEIELKKVKFLQFGRKKKIRNEISELTKINRKEIEEYENVKKDIEEKSKNLIVLDDLITKQERAIDIQKKNLDEITEKIKALELKATKTYVKGLELYRYEDIKPGDIILFGKQNGIVISWDVLETSPDEITLISHYVLDVGAFNESSDQLLNGSNYYNSLIRSHMNNALMNEIFTKEDRKQILLTKVNNSIESTRFNNVLGMCETNGELVCDDTLDYLYPISASEVYKYYPKKFQSLCNATPEAVRRGLNRNKKTGFSVYWTRTPMDKDNSYFVVSDTKEPDLEHDYRLDHEYVSKQTLGIRPMMKMKLASNDEILEEAFKVSKEKINNN